MSLPDAVRMWLNSLATQGKSSHTLQAYQRATDHFVHWNQAIFHEECKPAAIIPRDIRDWQPYQHKVEPASASTINQRLVVLP
ncbi:MAG: site-specific integrase [Anaerolineae bacterium]|nr:site-specific integrase [Anaerolineae bacterium]